MNESCQRCELIEKWIEHFGCTPKILDKYKKLLEFVKECAQLKYPASSFVGEADQYVHDARELLKEIGEYR